MRHACRTVADESYLSKSYQKDVRSRGVFVLTCRCVMSVRVFVQVFGGISFKYLAEIRSSIWRIFVQVFGCILFRRLVFPVRDNYILSNVPGDIYCLLFDMACLQLNTNIGTSTYHNYFFSKSSNVYSPLRIFEIL